MSERDEGAETYNELGLGHSKDSSTKRAREESLHNSHAMLVSHAICPLRLSHASCCLLARR